MANPKPSSRGVARPHPNMDDSPFIVYESELPLLRTKLGIPKRTPGVPAWFGPNPWARHSKRYHRTLPPVKRI